MSCEYCRHESLAYHHVTDEDGEDLYLRVASPLPCDDGSIAADSEPLISWCVEEDAIDWADHRPRLVVGAFDRDGDEALVAIPITYCPLCGRKLPTSAARGDIRR